MKKTFSFFLVICFYIIITPAFQCGESPLNDCTEYKQDTAMLHVQIPGNNVAFHLLDTIHITSVINDTIQSVKGKKFLCPINTLNTSIQAYKVIQSNTSTAVNYANIEFNAVVSEGEFQHTPYQGFTFLYKRVQPYNRLNASLIPGVKGLYLVVLSSADYGLFIREPNNYCDSYTAIHFIQETQQQKQYWDSLGTTALRLSGSNNYIVANKTDKNYFFLKVN